MKNLIRIPLIIPITLALLLYSAFVLALPQKPMNPESIEAFTKINTYYGIETGLPNYSVKEISDQLKDSFIYRSVTLTIQSPILRDQNELKFFLKIPAVSSRPNYPAIALFSGFQTGQEAVDLIENQGENILLGFQYPMPINLNSHQWNWDWSSFESIPLLMTVAIHWLHQQNYINSSRINILSVSFGSIFTPLALRWMQMFNINIKTTILGYGGGDIPLVVGNELKNYLGKNETEIIKILLTHQTWIYEPKYHVAQLAGTYLIVHGQDDQVFPAESIAVFDDKILAQKKIITLPGSHIQPDRKDLIDNFIKIVREFLVEQNAIN